MTARLLPLALAASMPLVAAALIAPSSPNTPARPAAAPLSLSQHCVNLGRVDRQPAVGATYDLTNTSNGLVRIVTTEPSCSCLEPSLSHETVAPGQTISLSLRMKTAGERAGEHEQTVRIVSVDGEGAEHEQSVRFRVTLPTPSLVVSPRSLMFYQLRGQSGEQTVTLRDDRGIAESIDAAGRVLVTGVRVADVAGQLPISEFVSVNRVATDGGTTTATVQVAEGLPPGRRTGWVIFETTDPSQPRTRVPVLLEGRYVRTVAKR